MTRVTHDSVNSSKGQTLARVGEIWSRTACVVLLGCYCPMDDYCIMNDLQPEGCEWLLKSALAVGGGILWRPRYRPHSLFFLR